MAVLVNPVSGRRAGERTAAWLRARWPADRVAVVSATEATARTDRLLALAAGGTRAVLVQGGDGSLGAALTLLHGCGFFDAGGVLGLIPSGSGNDFARAVGLPRHPAPAEIEALVEAALAHATADPEPGRQPARGRVLRLDALAVRCGDRELLAANSLNVGFDAEVNLRANALHRVPAEAKYLLGLLGAVPSFRPFTAGFRADDGPAHRRRRTLVAVLNGPFVGGGIRLGPGAAPDDGLLDLVELGPVGAASLAALFPTAYAGLHVHHPALETSRITCLELDLPAGVAVCADGEELHRGAGPVRVEARVARKSWRLLVASGSM